MSSQTPTKPRKPGRLPKAEAERRYAVTRAMLLDGHDTAAIARELGVAWHTARRWVLRAEGDRRAHLASVALRGSAAEARRTAAAIHPTSKKQGK